MDLIQIFSPECKSKSISGGFIHQAGIFGVKCFSIFCGLILADSKSGEILVSDINLQTVEIQMRRLGLCAVSSGFSLFA